MRSASLSTAGIVAALAIGGSLPGCMGSAGSTTQHHVVRHAKPPAKPANPLRFPQITGWPGVIAYGANFHYPTKPTVANAIFTLRAGGRPHRIFQHPQAEVGEIAFSPDGTRIAFTLWTLTSSPPYTVWVMATRGGQARQVISDHWSAGDIAWSPDGGSIAVSAVRSPSGDGGVHLLLVHANGGPVRDLTPPHMSAWSPSWPTGGDRWLAYAVGPNAHTGPTAIDEVSLPSGTHRRQLLAYGGEDPIWLRSGTGVVFDGAQDLYVATRLSLNSIALLEPCDSRIYCTSLRPLALLPRTDFVGFEATFTDPFARLSEVDAVPLSGGAGRRVLVEPRSGCCAAWWPGPEVRSARRGQGGTPAGVGQQVSLVGVR
jgi:Tol biopolymer transport system component